jgi:hypothetical protein
VPAGIVDPKRVTAVDCLLKLATPVLIIVFGTGPDAVERLGVEIVSLVPDEQFDVDLNRRIWL